MPRPPAPCGTLSAYKRHRRKGEAVDAECMAAMRADSAARSTRRDDQETGSPIVALPGGSVQMPDAPSGDLDARAELLANMALVKRAMEAIADADPIKIVQLSKRHSELVEQLVEVATKPAGGSASPGEAKGGDPFSGIFGGVAGRSASAPRKQA